MIHTVRSGECLYKLAAEHGLSPEKIWNHPRNASLRQARGPQQVVKCGDQIFLPVSRPIMRSAQSGCRHRYRRKGLCRPFVSKLIENGQPRSNTVYVLDLGTYRVQGCTDEQGVIRQWVPPWALHATLEVDGETFQIMFARENRLPDDPDGTRLRLRNLGYLRPTVADDPNALLKALARFQSDYDLKPTGRADELTRYKLRLIHGS